MNKFRFLDWKVYQDAKELFSLILRLVKKLPKEYRFELGSQLIRAPFSVVLNIAEGSGKSSDSELNRFFNIAPGSLNETLAAVDVIYYNRFIEIGDINLVCEKVSNISNQLEGFKKKLKKNRG